MIVRRVAENYGSTEEERQQQQMRTQIAVGTPVYMSPEYLSLGVISPAVDM